MDKFISIPECGWACRIDPENFNSIDLSDGSCVELKNEGKTFVWYDIEGCEIERFEKGSTDFDGWMEVMTKLKAGLAA